MEMLEVQESGREIGQGPFLRVPRVETGALACWEDIRRCFSGVEAIVSCQGWRSAPDAAFLPMAVRVVWTRDALCVLADLQDKDIFNPELRFNAPAFTSGDVFEMFLRPLPAARYWEFHVGPQNQKFQLQIPSADAFRSGKGKGIPAEWYVPEPVFTSRVEVEPREGRWSVFCQIPFDVVHPRGAARSGDRWLFSFSRYDYARDLEHPVLSSTSPHKILNYHRQEEWGTLEFV